MMRTKHWLVIALLAVALGGLRLQGEVAHATPVIDVSQPVQITSDSHYERGQSIVYDGADYWLFYGRSDTVTGNYDGDNPDSHDYKVYFQKASSVPGLVSATPVLISGVANNANSYLGETGAAYIGGEIWAFATVDVGATAELYGWYTTDGGTTWTEVGPIVSGLSDGQAHHDEVAFGGELWVVEGSGDFTTTHSATPKAGGWSAPLVVDPSPAVTGGLAHFFVEGSDLYLAAYSNGKNYIYKYNSGTVAWDKVDEIAPPEKYDPTLFKVGSAYVFGQAPWVSDGTPGGRQYIIAWSSGVLDGTFFDGAHTSVTEGKYGTNSWVDMWPIGFTDAGGDTYLLYTSERDQPTAEGTGNIWYLKWDWDPANDHYTYIQEAVNGASPGDTINVADGVYTASSLASIVITTDGLTLDGQSRDGTIIDGGAWGSSGAGWPRGIHVYANDVTIRDLTVRGFTGDTVTTGGYGILFRDYAHDTPGEGYIFYSGGLVDNVKLENNYSSLYALVHRNLTVQDSLIQNSLSDGMFIARESDDATITGNTVLNSGDHGIWVGYCWSALGPSDNATITDNVVDGAREGGISFLASNTALISGNDVSHVKGEEPEGTGGWSRGAISLKDGVSNVTVSDNVVHDNDGLGTGSGRGLGIDGTSSNITVTGNTIRDNAGGGIKVMGSTTGWSASSNSIYGNAGFGAENTTGAMLDFTDNWWGSANGATHSSNKFNVGSQGDAVSDNVDFVPWLDAAPPAGDSFAPVTTTDPVGDHASIQAGVDFSNPGGTVNAAAGTFTEQLDIGKPLTLTGAGQGSTIIKSPPVLATKFVISGKNYKPVVNIHDATGVTVQQLTVDGDGKGNGNSLMEGIAFYNAGGTVDYVTITGVRETPLSGTQNANGLYVNNVDSVPRTLSVSNNTINDYQKGAMSFFGAGLTLTVTDNTVTCSGPTTVIAQNGIQVSSGPSATIQGNDVSGCIYTGPSSGNDFYNGWQGTAISGYNASGTVNVSGNTVTDNDMGIYSRLSSGAAAIQDNIVQGNLYFGIVFRSGDVTATGNIISGSEVGILVPSTRAASSSPPTAHGNSITGNAPYAVRNDASYLADASANWWGANTPAGVAAQVSANVDYTPWLDSGTDKEPGTPGFQGDFSVLNVDDDSPQTGTTGRIQEGVNLVSGSTVNVAAGTYNERVTVNKSLDLHGAQYGVDPTQPGARTNPAEESVIDLTGLPLQNPNVLVEIAGGTSNVSIAGFTLIGSPTFHYADEAIIRAWDNDIAIEDNILNGFIGVLYKGLGQNVDVLRNRVTFNKSGFILQPNGANNVNLSDNVLALGSSPAGDESAIYLTGVTQGTVSGNTAVNLAPNGRGVVGSNLTQLTVSDNTLTGNKDAVSFWGNTTFITINGNDLSNAARYGVNIKGQDIAITGNQIKDCGDIGVMVDKHTLNTERVTVSGNDLSGNTNFGVKVNTALVTEVVNAEDNWWGSANGPTHASNTFNVGSQGVPVSDGADFVPWLDAAPPGGVSFAPVTTTNPVDSYASIQAGVDGSNDSGTVNAKAGTFTETVNVDGRSDISVTGEDRDTVIVKPASTLCWNVGTYGCGRRVAVRVADSTGIGLSGMTFDFDLVKADGVTGMLYWDSTGVIDDNILENMSVPDTPDDGGYSEIMTYVRSPGYTDGARAAVTVSNNIFRETGRVALLTHDFSNVTVQGNAFAKTVDDFGYAIEMGSESTGTISGNTISGYDTPALSDGSTAAGIYVENAFTGTCFGTGPHVDKPVTISGNNVFGNQYGLWLGNEYDCFAGDVDISITLLGNDIHDNLEAGVYVVDEDRADGSSMTLNASGNTLSNNGKEGYHFFTYRDGEVHAVVSGDTISGQRAGVLVDECVDDGPDDMCPAGASASLYDVEIGPDNHVTAPTAGSSYTGLEAIGVGGLNVHDNVFTGGFDAIRIRPSVTGTISGNVASGYAKNGITIGKAADDNTGTNVTVSGNTVTGGGAGQVYAQNGIQVGPNAVAAIENNTVSDHVYTLGAGDCAGPGTKADATYYASCWTAAGVLVYQGTATLAGNVITGNQVGIDVASSAEVHYNEITDNVIYGMNNNTTVVMDAEQNWWGACSGPYHPTLSPLGDGDAVSDYVDFDPWISGPCDYDGDRLSDDQERLVIGTDWRNPDTDGDGCDDGREYVSMPGFDPLAWYDVYDVPVPANADPAANGPRNRLVDMGDVLAVLLYAFADDGGPANANGIDYDSVKGSCDANGDTMPDEEGMCYDRTPGQPPSPPWEAGPPNGVIDMSDVLSSLAQAFVVDCSAVP